MNDIEIEKFRSDFKTIVYLRSEIVGRKNHVALMSRYDKNGSHDNAILRGQEMVKKTQARLNEMLRGRIYEEWLAMSKKISAIQAKQKRAQEQIKKGNDNLTNAIHELNEIKFQ